MAAGNEELLKLIDVALGIARDKAFREILMRVQVAQREYLITQADANRKKASEIIRAMASLDIEMRKFEAAFQKIEKGMSQEAKAPFLKLIDALQAQRCYLNRKKKEISSSIPQNLPITSSAEDIYGTPLLPGDVLAASRKAGLYQHFAIYIGNQRVIHYAAEMGIFQAVSLFMKHHMKSSVATQHSFTSLIFLTIVAGQLIEDRVQSSINLLRLLSLTSFAERNIIYIRQKKRFLAQRVDWAKKNTACRSITVSILRSGAKQGCMSPTRLMNG